MKSIILLLACLVAVTVAAPLWSRRQGEDADANEWENDQRQAEEEYLENSRLHETVYGNNKLVSARSPFVGDFPEGRGPGRNNELVSARSPFVRGFQEGRGPGRNNDLVSARSPFVGDFPEGRGPGRNNELVSARSPFVGGFPEGAGPG